MLGADTAESQLDALFQIAECTEAIGWRLNSRHILLLLSDALYHKAGDGRVNTLKYSLVFILY